MPFSRNLPHVRDRGAHRLDLPGRRDEDELVAQAGGLTVARPNPLLRHREDLLEHSIDVRVAEPSVQRVYPIPVKDREGVRYTEPRAELPLGESCNPTHAQGIGRTGRSVNGWSAHRQCAIPEPENR